MQYVDFEMGGAPSSLSIKEHAPLSTPAGKVKVSVVSFGINRADILQRQGKYPAPKGESSILGLEVAGTVIEVTEGVTEFAVGDKVFGLVEIGRAHV